MRTFLSGFAKTMVAVASVAALSATAAVPAGAAETAYPTKNFRLGDSYVGGWGTMIFYNRVVNIVGTVDGDDPREAGMPRTCKYLKFSTAYDTVYSPRACGDQIPFEVNLPANYPGGARKVEVWLFHDNGQTSRSVDHDTIYP